MNITRIGLNRNEVAPRESIFHVANGYLGVRACFEEGVSADVRSIRGTYLNAFYDLCPLYYTEKMHGFPNSEQVIVNVTDAQGIQLVLNGEPFDPFQGELKLFEQTLDMSQGCYIRHVLWRSPKGMETDLSFRRMASFFTKELLTIEVTVTPVNWSGEFRAVSTQNSDVYNDGDPNDPRKASEKMRMLTPVQSGRQSDCVYMQCETLRSGQEMACAVVHTFDKFISCNYFTEQTCNTVTLEGLAAQGEPLTFVKWCVYTDSRRHTAPLGEAVSLAETCSEIPLDIWYARQQAILNELWASSRIVVDDQPSLQAGIDYAIYTLFQSAGRDRISSIASKGLSGEGYEGHFFWDTEIYMFPFFLLTHPKIARLLLDFRYATLDAAREQARLLGHAQGALYPWRTITGTECSSFFLSGSAQYHINCDIAHAVIHYYFVTGDQAFMKEKGLEILIETARLWLDTGHWYNGQFRIDGVTGPDEYTCLVNNNYYTNLSVQFHLRSTLWICEQMEKEDTAFSAQQRYGFTENEKQSFREAADHIYLPYDEALGIYAQDDSFLQKERMAVSSLPKDALPLLLHYHPLAFYRRQICKQADAVLAHFLHEDGIPLDVIRRTYEYYEPITTHDSSLSPCVFSMMAARIGDAEKAFSYYIQTTRMDLDNKQHNTDDGIHAANMGGIYMGVVFGFAGLRIHANGLSLRPCLPASMNGYAFPIQYRGLRFHIAVSRETVTLQAEGSTSLSLTVYDTQYTIGTKPLTLPLQQ